jgi:hypothetical protein
MSRMGVALSLGVLAGGLVTVLGGCGTLGDQCDSCHAALGAIFNFACSPSDLTSVAVSGPCSLIDASVWQRAGAKSFDVESPPSPGVCHVELTFATGFTYSADVTFTWQSGGCSGCPSTIGPTQGEFTVNNPRDTCVAFSEDGAAVDANPEGGWFPCKPKTCRDLATPICGLRPSGTQAFDDGCGGLTRCDVFACDAGSNEAETGTSDGPDVSAE